MCSEYIATSFGENFFLKEKGGRDGNRRPKGQAVT